MTVLGGGKPAQKVLLELAIKFNMSLKICKIIDDINNLVN